MPRQLAQTFKYKVAPSSLVRDDRLEKEPSAQLKLARTRVSEKISRRRLESRPGTGRAVVYVAEIGFIREIVKFGKKCDLSNLAQFDVLAYACIQVVRRNAPLGINPNRIAS